MRGRERATWTDQLRAEIHSLWLTDRARGTRPEVTVASVTTPAGLARVRGLLEVKGSIDKDVVSYNLAYGAGINPDQWISIGGSDPKLRDETGSEAFNPDTRQWERL